MSKIRSLSDCYINLNSLLNCNIEQLEFNELKKLIRKRHLQWHPDKNPDNPNLYRDKWISLFKSWKYYLKHVVNVSESQPSTSSEEPDNDNLFSDSEVFSDEDMDYNQTPYSDDFFYTSPTKDFKQPESHKNYYRSATNRRAGKSFIIYCLATDLDFLKTVYDKYNCLCDYFGIFKFYTNKSLCGALLSTLNEYRILDIKKNCKAVNLKIFKIEYCVKFKSFIEFCVQTHGEPCYEPCNDARGKTKKQITQVFNNNLIVSYAISHNVTNVLTLMSMYSHLAKPCIYSNAENDHLEEHSEHLENAISFNYLGDRKRAATNAVNCVIADRFQQTLHEKPWSFIERKVKEYSDKLYVIDDVENLIGSAYLYSHVIFKKFKPLSLIIFNTFTEGRPRRRWTILKGPYKSGKTSYAAAICKFFEGVNINVNVDKNRLSFFLGNAIGRRFVLFDDVKGRSVDNTLTSGYGFKNLDDLRDHLDGHTEVLLEKKNQQPLEQIFPPGIITCNDYFIEPALLERVNGPIKLKPSPLFADHEMIVTPEIIFLGLVLHNIVPVEGYVMEFISKKLFDWKKTHSSTCDCLDKVRPSWEQLLVHCLRLVVRY